MSRPARIGAVAYLNSKPLIYRLRELAVHYDLLTEVPSRLADLLALGEIDVGLIPVLEFFRHPEYQIVGDVCIACEGPVYSVKLFSRVPVAQIASIALDEGSRTSVGLVRVLLEQRYGIRPSSQPLALEDRPAEVQTDALLLIGDRAIHPPPGRWWAVWDLGEEWTQWTGLPFVFALWAARPGVDVEELGQVLRAVRDLGLQHVDEIAAAEGPPVGLTVQECLRYLTVNLHYYLGPREEQGLELFRRKLQAIGALDLREPLVSQAEGACAVARGAS